MRIEMVLPSLARAGMETIVARLARRLAARGWRVGFTCIIEPGALAPELEAEGFRVSTVPTPGLATYAFPKALVAHLSKIRPDVLHAHSGAWLKGAVAGRRAGAKGVVYTGHGLTDDEPWHARYFDLAGAAVTDRIISVSDHLQTHLLRRGLPPRKMSVIVNGVDTERFRPGPSVGGLRAQLGFGPETLLIGTVARLNSVKNQALLIEGVAKARAAGCDCAAVLVGEGDLREALAAQARTLGVEDRVRFYGGTADPAPLYREFNVFALTSLVEGTSISMLEAMASGCCCVATAVGGNSALLEEGESGVLTPSGDADALAKALGALAADPERRRAFGRRARERVESAFSEAVMTDQYEAIYRELGVDIAAAARGAA